MLTPVARSETRSASAAIPDSTPVQPGWPTGLAVLVVVAAFMTLSAMVLVASSGAAGELLTLALCVVALGIYAMHYLARSQRTSSEHETQLIGALQADRSVLAALTATSSARSHSLALILDDRPFHEIDAAIATMIDTDPGNPDVLATARDLLSVAIQRRTTSETIRFQVSHDLVTGLPNRPGVVNMVAEMIQGGSTPALLAIDLAGLKAINGIYGYTVGDEVLREVASRLRGATGSGDVVGRFDGAEFVVALAQADRQEAEAAALDFIECLRAPLSAGADVVEFDANIGIVVSSSDGGLGPEQLLNDADRAMVLAKTQPERVVVFDERMLEMIEEQRELEIDLRRAISVDGFAVAFQPLVATADGQIRGVEALARWERNGRLCAPGDFLPLAERTGLITEIDRLVLATACREVMHLRRNGMPELELSANLSGVQLMLDDLVGYVGDTLACSGLPPTALTLEVTETVFVDGGGEVAERLNELRDLGVRIAVDDFGTGYSALQYLQRLPVDELKIDKAFVDRLGKDKANDALVNAVVSIAQAFDLLVVAEGVEHEGQVEALRTMGCDLCQGFYFARPMPASELLRWATRANPLELPIPRV